MPKQQKSKNPEAARLGQEMLCEAFRFPSDKTKIARLIEAGADINARQHTKTTALMVAAQYGKTEIVALLIEKGARLNLRDKFGLHARDFAVQYRQTEIVKMIDDAAKKAATKKPGA